ncbi:hypothetical protein Tco_0201821 [Tanacetum coccineum]
MSYFLELKDVSYDLIRRKMCLEILGGVAIGNLSSQGEILEDHFDGDRGNDTIEDNADLNPSTNVYLDVNQNTSIPEVVEELLHQDKCRVSSVKAAVNDSNIVSPSTPPCTVLNLAEESYSTWLDYVGPLITDELDSEKRWSNRNPDGNVQGQRITMKKLLNQIGTVPGSQQLGSCFTGASGFTTLKKYTVQGWLNLCRGLKRNSRMRLLL